MFRNARLKLTGWYLLIIMVISIFFSVIIYETLTAEVKRFARVQRVRIERSLLDANLTYSDTRQMYPPPSIPLFDPDLVNETNRRILIVLIGINTGIFFVAGGLGYLLAGRTLKPIQIMVDEQNRFISDASHELRTPLTALKTSMEVTLRDKKTTLATVKKLIAGSINEVNKLQSLSDGLLQLAQYQKPNHPIRFETLKIGEFVTEAIAKTKILADQKKIFIKKNIAEVQVEGNRYGLTDLFTILLDNAIKYSPLKGTVEITSSQNNGFVFIDIKDTGIGIHEKDLPFIFDRFYRADSARTKDGASGYGLGLSIAKKIVASHKGSVSVKSKINQGSSFTVKLPVKNK
jgi:signal transduction histidine kinase